jgi:hypothetical protein
MAFGIWAGIGGRTTLVVKERITVLRSSARPK